MQVPSTVPHTKATTAAPELRGVARCDSAAAAAATLPPPAALAAAIPLTMTAGMIFGTLQGTAITSISGTIAAAIAFLIARYAVRDKVRALAYSNPRFKAIDRAIGLNGLKVGAVAGARGQGPGV